MTPFESVSALKAQMSKSIIGQEKLIDTIVLVLLADGNMLLEGLPGLAKTRAINALSKNLDCGLSRIQFTPDLLPSDITGTEIYLPNETEKFMFQQGPIFSNLILADEINRAPAKVQSALLEAMEERQVTVSGKTYKMEDLFMVMATQNPIEQEGTYPLPEAQMDRFLVHTIIGYPDDDAELEIMRLNKREAAPDTAKEILKTIPQQAIFDARKEISKIKVSEDMEKYMVSLISASRYPEKYDAELDKLIDFGASPRGTIALDRCSRVHAWMQGRDFVTPEDIHGVIKDVLRHRIAVSYKGRAEGTTPDQIIDKLIEVVAVVA
ncbi:MoxR family ATPase [Tamlana sp. 2_MG-2023]|uniref:AAA family ATPase n=1 Tax=unclassified Tamlana TaxID=2614803 RepID=UPI0026E474D6|nr:MULTISPECIES: MoxR family ATPase [unclassified Tamlana]MDO6761392.1 MoxR family ATPase [Tamlana sp. 2_MG-2023]MDO6791994.1 MoxR family ATPase [Tamlana sp. 1_MG-2023]